MPLIERLPWNPGYRHPRRRSPAADKVVKGTRPGMASMGLPLRFMTGPIRTALAGACGYSAALGWRRGSSVWARKGGVAQSLAMSTRDMGLPSR